MKSLRGVGHALRSGKRPYRRVSRGQAMIEFALILFPLLLFLVVGATDISTLLDDHLGVVYAARAGARVGSVIGNYSPSGAPYTADCAVIGAVQSALAGTRNVTVSSIAIYKPNTTGVYSSALPQDVYPGNAICNSNGTVTPAATQIGWAPSTRCNVPFNEDSIGVAITFTYTYSFNLLNIPAPTVTDTAVMPIEIVVNPSSTTTSCP